LIIAAIAIPNLLRSRMAANEASAVGSMRTINTAAVTYLFRRTPAPATSQLEEPWHQRCGLFGSATWLTASGWRHQERYTFKFTGDGNTPSTGYSIVATPVSQGTSGQRGFHSPIESGVIRNDRRCGNSASAPLQ